MANIEALIRRNAEACETAKRPQCRCHCGGAFHRKKHSNEWILQTIKELSGEEAQNELDLGSSDSE
jgi:hypothetical protein